MNYLNKPLRRFLFSRTGALFAVFYIAGVTALPFANAPRVTPMPAAIEACSTDDECTQQCLRELPPNRPDSECFDDLIEV